MFSDLPFGGSLRSALAYSSPLLAPTSSAPSGPEFGGFWIEESLANVSDRERHEDHRGADRPADLQARVAVDLRGDRALAGAELDQRVEQRALDGDEDDERDDQRDLVEAVDAGSRSASRPTAGVKNASVVEKRDAPKAAGILFSPGRDALDDECHLADGSAGGLYRPAIAHHAAREARRALLDEGHRALQEVLAPGHLVLDLGLELELLGHPRVQPVVELALGPGVGARRPGGQARGQRGGLLARAARRRRRG